MHDACESNPAIRDQHGRLLGSLRLSVTDRCNLRCQYCMPGASYSWLPRDDLLSFEELRRLAALFVSLGADQIRLTGGEPLLRRNLPELVRKLANIRGLRDLALTTNGLLLASQAKALREAGLQRLTVSLDTLDPAVFQRMSRHDGHAEVLRGIDAAIAAGFERLKLDCVVLRGVNDHEIPALLDFARTLGAELRFIEYMDVGGAQSWTQEQVVSGPEILERVRAAFGEVRAGGLQGSAPATPWRLADGTPFGVIASMSAPFCNACVRSRVTADGRWYHCLYAHEGFDLRAPLRAGSTDQELAEFVKSHWLARSMRGALERQQAGSLGSTPGDSHYEMHVRGG
jgi:cyclic pyranopterin phosphate synthase